MQESPAQLLMSRMLKSKFPTTTALLQPKVQENVREKLEQRAEKQKRVLRQKCKAIATCKDVSVCPNSKRKGVGISSYNSEPPPNNLGPDYDEEIVMPEPRPNNVVDPQPVRRTSNRAVRLPERLRNDYVME
ncbi:Hypothetical predicted protein [Paramuricea clavata]|uniref:Uncharacterized protein n=1 Tax=Paramuricea clavata TaxID=317549 RepID=A0A7D9EKS7_PARCT|nr:Hypothetical predicted protein [Paramuricea clavata]